MGGEPMFGSVMIGRSTAPVEVMRSIVNDWADTIGAAAGFVDERALVTEDGRVVVCVRFADRASYERLADDPAQSAWWDSTLRPMLDGDPDWIDGTWHDI